MSSPLHFSEEFYQLDDFGSFDSCANSETNLGSEKLTQQYADLKSLSESKAAMLSLSKQRQAPK